MPSSDRLLTSLTLALARSGSWQDDKASGSGVLEYSNGDVYDGQWELDQRHGSHCTLLPSAYVT